MAVNGFGGGRPGGPPVRVIARVPVLDAEREAPPERTAEPPMEPPAATQPVVAITAPFVREPEAVPPVVVPETVAVPIVARCLSSRETRAHASGRFPARSVVVLSVMAALAWTAAWWNDRLRLEAERVAVLEQQTAVEQRPERLAREGKAAH
jgi:hypothetical protein